MRNGDYTPVRARRGTVVHALTLSALRTVCDRGPPRGGYVVAEARSALSCARCRDGLALSRAEVST